MGRRCPWRTFPSPSLLSRGETVRAEEMVLSVPDGRSITVLVNATPLRSEDDNEVETVVVTMQDMTPLEELEKMRAEFLGMVSHELRAPLTSIKGSVDTLLESFNSLDTAEMVQFIRIIKSQSDRMRGPDQRPAGRGPHRDRHVVGGSRAGGGGRPGGRGEEHLLHRRRPEKRHDRYGT